jgi:hypothetical protein
MLLAGFFLDLFFEPEDRGYVSPKLLNYIALQPIR